VPNHAVVGDRVVVLLGRSVPVLIRHIDKIYALFVGESYFHGVMDGESMDEGVIEDVAFE
jgi:hypothetical protein